ncbi:hypothetical protein GCM10023081_08540 [Arthrobacter ginkgonis]|uniref:Uncharacterized protein n=1 Tax=Arthrobacter ginkgonis TaxID=1630594 RepID=A0ABP7C093_9MICC
MGCFVGLEPDTAGAVTCGVAAEARRAQFDLVQYDCCWRLRLLPRWAAFTKGLFLRELAGARDGAGLFVPYTDRGLWAQILGKSVSLKILIAVQRELEAPSTCAAPLLLSPKLGHFAWLRRGGN